MVVRMKKKYHNFVIIIPSLEPTRTLVTYVKELSTYEFLQIIVINDGSSEEYNGIFKEVELVSGCTLLRHSVNQGKGAALKTGYGYVERNLPQCEGVITADSDGQHTIEDVCNIADELQNTEGTLILGSRNFSLPAIPAKSRLGNRISSTLFFCLYGKWIKDTQTGLRGFGKSLLGKMIEIKGARFEYEMQVIIECIIKKIPLKQIEIQTIYENNNESTHFQVVRDSIKIGKVIFSNFLKFITASATSAVIDIGIAWFLLDLLKHYLVNQELLRIGIATCMARVISMIINYSINKILVFEDKKKNIGTFIRYIALCIVIMLLSTLFVYGASKGFGWNEKGSKLVGDSLLFLLSYQMQRRWVFDKREGGK